VSERPGNGRRRERRSQDDGQDNRKVTAAHAVASLQAGSDGAAARWGCPEPGLASGSGEADLVAELGQKLGDGGRGARAVRALAVEALEELRGAQRGPDLPPHPSRYVCSWFPTAELRSVVSERNSAGGTPLPKGHRVHGLLDLVDDHVGELGSLLTV
jgi:hypothetical protein